MNTTPSRRIFLALGAALLVLAAYHAYAESAYRASFDGRALSASADAAHSLMQPVITSREGGPTPFSVPLAELGPPVSPSV